jgi:hypothetical protein
MARRIYADFDTELQQRLQNRTDITSTQRGFFLNDAAQMISNEFPHPEFEKNFDDIVVAGLSVFSSAATDIWWPSFVKDLDNERPIDLQPQQVIEAMRRVAGPITRYYWFNNQFWFDRSAAVNVNIRIWYKKTVPDFTSGSPLFRAIYDPLVPMRAAQIALSTVGDQTAAALQENEYAQYVARERFPKYESNRNDRRQQMRVRTR